MKKEKTVKTYQRRTKSGKVVTVRQHTAKYDAADKAAEASKKKGSGDELESLKKSKTMDTPVEISKDDFKEWYNFNEWDTPKKEWPESVKKVDSHLRKTMGKKGYDDYCAKIDESWSARGHLKAYKDLSSESKSKPKPLFTKKGVVSQVNEEPKKVNHIDKDFMDVYNNKIKKGTYDRMSDYKDQNDFRFKEALKTLKGSGYKVTFHKSDGQDGSLLNVTDPQGKKVISDTFAKDSAAGNGHLLTLERLAFTKNRRKEKTKERSTPIFDTKGTSTKPKSIKEELSSLLNGLSGSTLRTFKKPAKFTSRKDGTLEASVYDSDISDNLKKAGWKNIDSVGIVGGTSNYVSPDGKYHAIVGRSKTRIKAIRNGEKVNGHSLDSIFNRGNKEEGNKYD